MDVRSTLKEKDRETYRKMPRGRRIELAIELSEFTLSLTRSVKTDGKRVQRGRKGAKGGQTA